MLLFLKNVTFDISVRSPGPRSTQESFFQSAKGAGDAPIQSGVVDDLTYDPATGLIRIRRGSASRWVHVMRARDMEIDEAPPAAATVKVAPAKPAA